MALALLVRKCGLTLDDGATTCNFVNLRSVLFTGQEDLLAFDVRRQNSFRPSSHVANDLGELYAVCLSATLCAHALERLK